MTARSDLARSPLSFAIGWAILLIISSTVGLFGIYALAIPVDTSFFEDVTGLPWEEFAMANPAVAENMQRENRLLGISVLGMSVLSLAVTWSPLRRSERWAVRAMWALPLTLAGYSLLFISDGIGTLSLFYGLLTIVAAVGLILVARSPRARSAPILGAAPPAGTT